MLETELFDLLRRAGDAAYTVTTDGTIRSWNPAAERLFGYSEAEVAGRNVDDVLDARDGLDTRALAAGADAAVRHVSGSSEPIADFDIEVRARDGRRLWVNVSTIIMDRERRQPPLIVRLARDVTARREQSRLLSRAIALGRELVALEEPSPAPAPVDALSEQERRILTLFARGASAAGVQRELQISAHTLRNHLHRINRKLRTGSRLEAVTHAQRRGLID